MIKTIFSTGVHLQAIECKIDGQRQWRWVAIGFEDDSYLNGKIIAPNEYADKCDGLLNRDYKE